MSLCSDYNWTSLIKHRTLRSDLFSVIPPPDVLRVQHEFDRNFDKQSADHQYGNRINFSLYSSGVDRGSVRFHWSRFRFFLRVGKQGLETVILI